MATVEQEIELMDESTFESFVHATLQSLYPSAGIKKVDGSGGDEGIDSFEGSLADGPAIWQCKHVRRLRQAQKKQILSSLVTALEHRELKSWTLCVPIDLRTAEHEWFEKTIVSEYSNRVRTELLQKSDLANKVHANSQLLDRFFSNTQTSNLLRLKEAIFGEPTSDVDRELLNVQAERYFSRLRALDGRLAPSLTVSGGSFRPEVTSPETLFTVRGPRSTLYLSAEDKDALAKDPIVLTCLFRPDLLEMVENALDTGEPFTLGPGAVLGMKANSPLIQSLLPADTTLLQFETLPPPPGAFPDLHLRLVSGRSRTAKEIGFVQFRLVRYGRREMAYAGQLPGMKFVIRITRDTQQLFINFQSQFQGVDVRQIQRLLEFMYELERTGRLDIYDISTQQRIYTQHLTRMASVDECFHLTSYNKRMLRDACAVADHFARSIPLPHTISDDDACNLNILAKIVRQQRCSRITLTAKLVKQKAEEAQLRNLFTGPTMVQLNQKDGERLELFGQRFHTEPIVFRGEGVRVVDPETFWNTYGAAPDGAKIPINLECETCEFSFEHLEKTAITFSNDQLSLDVAT